MYRAFYNPLGHESSDLALDEVAGPTATRRAFTHPRHASIVRSSISDLIAASVSARIGQHAAHGVYGVVVTAGDESTFMVRETGVGISPDHLAHVFDMFWQADSDLTRRVGGSGLGLNVSRHFAELLGGRLTAESVEGEGSTFTLIVPLQPPEGNTAL